MAERVETAPLKRTVYRVLESGGAGDRLGGRCDRMVVALIVATVVAALLETVPSIAAAHGRMLAIVEFCVGAVFSVEYLARLWVADLHPPLRRFGPLGARLRYAVTAEAIVDLVAILPFFLSMVLSEEGLRVLVVVRLLRFLKLARYSPAMRSLISAVASERHALLASLVIIIGVVLLAATGMYLVERHVQPREFGTVPAAMWWAITTLTTVGYGDVVPVTPTGKLLAGIVMLMGYGLLALPVGIVATAFAREIHSRDFVVTWAMVARVPLFEDLKATEVAEVAKLLRAQSVRHREVITHKGEEADCMYFIAKGAVDIDLGDSQARLGEGAFFGEMAILGNRRRLATTTAAEDTQLMVLEAADLHRLLQHKPDLAERILQEVERRGTLVPDTESDIAAEELDQSNRIAMDMDAETEAEQGGEPDLFAEKEAPEGGKDRYEA